MHLPGPVNEHKAATTLNVSKNHYTANAAAQAVSRLNS